MKKKSILKDCLLSVLSAGLLILSFPPFSLWPLAWVSFVPLLMTFDQTKAKSSFLITYLSGFVFFACMIYWFMHVTVVGAVLLVAYFSVYFGAFGFCAHFFCKRSLGKKIIVLPGLWVLLEFLRAHLLSGFGWVSLGHSQASFLTLIQFADVAGVWGVSFVVMAGNVFFAQCLQVLLGLRFLSSEEFDQKRNQLFVVGAIGFCCLTAMLIYGMRQLDYYRRSQPEASLLVAVVQANIAQEDKWQEISWPQTRDRYMALTKQAAAALIEQQKVKSIPGVIVWPETAFPGFLWEDQDFFEEIQALVQAVGVPLLFGSVVYEEEQYFNAAILLSKQGDFVEQYNKLHLVPFGEYLPLRQFMPALADLVPIADFSPGERWTVFSADSLRDFEQAAAFSVLVCFEDTMASLARGFVNHGARLLINMTNDAWFKESKASVLHMNASLFRAVENRRVLIRAANTGVSCVIRPTGEIKKDIRNPQTQSSFVAGFFVEEVGLFEQISFYTKHGDVFIGGVVLCFLLFLGFDLFACIIKKRQALK